MLYSILLYIACLLAVFGAFSLVSCLFDAIRSRSTAALPGVKVIVAVRDAEEQIEYIVRNAVKADLAARLMSGGNITFIDMDSRDETYIMLQKLQKDYGNIDLLKAEELDRAFSPMKN